MNMWRKLIGPAQLILPNIIAALLTTCPSGPRSSSVTPDIGNQGTDVPIVFSGANFVVTSPPNSYPVIVIDGNRNEGVTTDFDGSTDPYYDTFINLTLHIAPTARLGAHTIVVDTFYGITSPQTFYVTCPGCPPPPHLLVVITQPENTPLIPGGAPVTFRFTGTNFFNANPQVHFADPLLTPDPAPPVVQQTGCPDHCLDYFDLPITAAAEALPGRHSVWVTTTGGTSNDMVLTVNGSVLFPTPTPGATPTLRNITPTHVCKCGEYVNIKCEGSGFGTFPEVLLDNPNVQVATSWGVYQANRDQVAVVRLFVPNNIPDTSVQVRIQNQDTYPPTTSEPFILSLDQMNPERPLVYRFSYGGSVYQGGDTNAVIAGENLEGTTEVSFSGIPGLAFSNVHWDILGLNVHVHADGTTPVTGDEATNLTITTDKGQSNLFSFRILPQQ